MPYVLLLVDSLCVSARSMTQHESAAALGAQLGAPREVEKMSQCDGNSNELMSSSQHNKACAYRMPHRLEV